MEAERPPVPKELRVWVALGLTGDFDSVEVSSQSKWYIISKYDHIKEMLQLYYKVNSSEKRINPQEVNMYFEAFPVIMGDLHNSSPKQYLEIKAAFSGWERTDIKAMALRLAQQSESKTEIQKKRIDDRIMRKGE